MRPQLLIQRPNPKRDNMIWSSLIQRVRENWSDQMMIYSENPFLCASDLKILRIQRSSGWNIHEIPYATDDSAAFCFCVLLCFHVLMILCLGIATDFGSRASWPFSPFLCIYFVASLCFSVFMVSWFGASVVSYLHGSSDSSASLSSQPVSLFLYLFCIFLGVRSFSRRWFHIRPNNQLLKPKFASNIRFIAFPVSTKQRFRVRGRFGVWSFFI